MGNELRRHDLTDKQWELIKPHTIGNKGAKGGNARDTRLFVNAVFWILRTGAPWRDLPKEYGDWKNTHRRFCRWRDKHIWENILQAVMMEHDFEWLIIDATHIKAHHHSCGAKGGNQEMGVTKGGSTQRYIWPWMRLVCQSDLLLQQVPNMIVKLHLSLLKE